MSAIISAIRRISGCMHGKSGLDRASSVIKFSHCPETQFRSIHSGYPQSDENPTEVGAPEGHSDLQFCVVGSGPSGFYTVSQVQPLPRQNLLYTRVNCCMQACEIWAFMLWQRKRTSHVCPMQLLKRFGDGVKVSLLVSYAVSTSTASLSSPALNKGKAR
jgi:hypothetical protein